jgi:hypothetical protein
MDIFPFRDPNWCGCSRFYFSALSINHLPKSLLRLMFRSASIRVIHWIRLIRGVPLSFGIWGWITFSHRDIVTPQLKQKLASAAMIPRIVGFRRRAR